MVFTNHNFVIKDFTNHEEKHEENLQKYSKILEEILRN